MNWGSRMKAMYISGVVILLLLVIGIPVYFKYFNHPPSCFDGKQNQDEAGIDCGGSACALLCPFESRDPLITFQRLYEANPGVYTALAMLENPNQGVFAREISYVFKIYDVENVLLFEINGKTFIPPGREFPVFASPVLTGNRIASKETFAITSNIAWEKGEWKEPNIAISNVTNGVVGTGQRITADIVNHEVYPLRDLEIVAVVYDELGNARQASATVASYISPEGDARVTFTWGAPFEFTVSKVDIIPRVLPRNFSSE